MRSDLNKQLCERQRRGSSMSYSPWRRDKRHEEQYQVGREDDETFDGVSSGHRESMTKRYGWDRKSFNENLKPLYGFIHKSVGRKWDDVYSEICSVFDKRSVINQHILTHLEQYVEQQINVGEDGKLYIADYQYITPRKLPRLLEESSYTEYYVDPRDGILKRNVVAISRKESNKRARVRLEAKKALTQRIVNKTTELHKIKFVKVDGIVHAEDGVWYEVKFSEQKPVRRFEYWQPIWAKKPMSREVVEYPYAMDVLRGAVHEKRYASEKRQLARKDLKHYGLTNGE
jgi:hypothetical protein